MQWNKHDERHSIENDIAVFYLENLKHFSVACIELVDNDDKISLDPYGQISLNVSVQ